MKRLLRKYPLILAGILVSFIMGWIMVWKLEGNLLKRYCGMTANPMIRYGLFILFLGTDYFFYTRNHVHAQIFRRKNFLESEIHMAAGEIALFLVFSIVMQCPSIIFYPSQYSENAGEMAALIISNVLAAFVVVSAVRIIHIFVIRRAAAALAVFLGFGLLDFTWNMINFQLSIQENITSSVLFLYPVFFTHWILISAIIALLCVFLDLSALQWKCKVTGYDPKSEVYDT